MDKKIKLLIEKLEFMTDKKVVLNENEILTFKTAKEASDYFLNPYMNKGFIFDKGNKGLFKFLKEKIQSNKKIGKIKFEYKDHKGDKSYMNQTYEILISKNFILLTLSGTANMNIEVHRLLYKEEIF